MRLEAPAAHQTTAPTAAELRDRWLGVVAAEHGIDFARWTTTEGIAPVRDIVRRSYGVYATLYLEHPELRWAGMANLISPTFLAGFDDLDTILRLRGRGRSATEHMPAPGGIRDAVEGALGLDTRSLEDVRFLETTLLSMQREIFTDAMVMHEAYLHDGLRGVHELERAGVIDEHARHAWELIDHGARTGSDAEVNAGNAALLWREQMQVVADDYDAIRQRGRFGRLMTYAMTTVGRPAIPGASSPGEFDPLRIGRLRLPMPGMDVSNREQRWAMIEHDTLPAYERLVHDRPAELRAILGTDLDSRIRAGGYRHVPDGLSPGQLGRFLRDKVGAVVHRWWP